MAGSKEPGARSSAVVRFWSGLTWLCLFICSFVCSHLASSPVTFGPALWRCKCNNQGAHKPRLLSKTRNIASLASRQQTNTNKQTNKQQTHRAKTVRVHSGLDRSTNDLGKGKLTIMALLRLNVYSSIRNSIRRRLIEGVHTVKWENQSRTTGNEN